MNLDMRSDLPGNLVCREMRMLEDQCQSSNPAICRCAEGSLDFLGSEWGPPPSCLLNITKAVFKPERLAVLHAGLTEAATATDSAPAGAPLSANISILYYMIKMGDTYIKEIAANIASFINQDRISCDLGKQLAEDHVAHMTLLLDEARAHLSAGMERAGFAQAGQRTVLHQKIGDHAIYMLAPPDGADIIALNRLKCKHDRKIINCRMDINCNSQEATPPVEAPKSALKSATNKGEPSKRVNVKDLNNPTADIRENPEALQNTRSVETIFIGGETIFELKTQAESQFQDTSLTASVHKAAQLEESPKVLKEIAEGRHPLDLSSLRVILVPLHSNKNSRIEIEDSVAETVFSCMKYLDEFCTKNHLSKLKRDIGHNCAVEILMPPKIPALSATTQILGKVNNSGLISHLENEANKTRAIHSALGRFKQYKRVNVHTSKDVCFINPKAENYLRNFKTHTGERGTMGNLKELLYLEGNLRGNFVNFLVQLAAIRHSELWTPQNYHFLLDKGLSVVPPTDKEDRNKRPRSSSAHSSKNKSRRNNKDHEDDLRDRLNSDRARGRK